MPNDESKGRGAGTWGTALAIGAVLFGALATAGCAADATATEENPSASDAKGGTEEGKTSTAAVSLTGVGQTVTGTLSGVAQTVGVCAPLTCCFPTGSQWQDDPFQDALKALGCSTPQAYTERYGSSDWWMLSQCTATPALLALVAKYATVAPYDAQLAVNECVYVSSLTQLQLSSVFVEFDPTCSSCKSAK